jgi:hypothetical protein
MITVHQKIGRRTSDALRKKEIDEPSIKDLLNTTKEAEPQTMAEGMAEAHTRQNLHTECTMAVKPTITPKIAPFTSTPRGKWIKNPLNIHQNHHPEKSTTPCSGTLTTSNTPYPILRYFHHTHTKTTTHSLPPITNPTITPPLTNHNLRRFHK